MEYRTITTKGKQMVNIKIYGYMNLKTHKIVYVGLDTTGKRHQNHMKPSKYNEQAINMFIQDNEEGDVWEYIELATCYPAWNLDDKANKKLAHEVEMAFIKALQPLFNIKGIEEENEK